MVLTLVKEDGSGLSNANSYANATDGDSYHDGHLYATTWTAASSGNRDAALVMATRLLDENFRFRGKAVSSTQALQFPRFDIYDRGGFLIQSSTIPADLINATCELARWLLASDRTAETDDRGFKSIKAGSVAIEIDKHDRTGVIPRVVAMMLKPYGSPGGGLRVVR